MYKQIVVAVWANRKTQAGKRIRFWSLPQKGVALAMIEFLWMTIHLKSFKTSINTNNLFYLFKLLYWEKTMLWQTLTLTQFCIPKLRYIHIYIYIILTTLIIFLFLTCHLWYVFQPEDKLIWHHCCEYKHFKIFGLAVS